MIIRIRFVDAVENENVVYSWCLFSVPDSNTLMETFHGIYSGQYTCGRPLDFNLYERDEFLCSVATTKTVPTKSDMMPSPPSMRLSDLKETNISLFVQFDLQRRKVDTESSGEADVATGSGDNHENEDEVDSITNFLMNRRDFFVKAKQNSKNSDTKQFNAIVALAKEKKWSVRATSLDDFTECLQLFSDLLWEIDPHYTKIKSHAQRFPEIVENRLMNFNDPKTHKHPNKNMDIYSLMSKVTKLTLYLERKYMSASQMKPLENMISSVLKSICKYDEYLRKQRLLNAKVREQEEPDTPMDSIENYSATMIKQTLDDSKPYMKHFASLKDVLESTDVNVPININETIDRLHRDGMYNMMKSLREIGFPSISGNYEIFYFRLPSHGPHRQINFIWKVIKDCPGINAENAKIVTTLRDKQGQYYSRASRRLVKDVLHRIGIVKPYKAEYLIRTLLGDASAPHDSNQASILQRFSDYVSLGEDIICDLRENNGSKPRFDEFWDIVKEFIENKTAVNDRRWGSEVDGEIVVTMAMATSLADIYRQCAKVATTKTPPVEVPSQSWFRLQFWPSSKSMSSISHHTGRFKVKRMVQARLMRKNNTDSHYTNAIYSFLKERALKHANSTAMVSADAKCKVSVGEPDFPIASVSRGKAVIVGSNETFKVGDHDFSKVSLIPDATLIHYIPEDDIEQIDCNKETVGKWYTGKVFYSVKNMSTEGSTAERGATELSLVLKKFYGSNIPPRVSIYADGGGDRKNNNFKVQKSLIAVWKRHDLDEIVSARPAAGHSYRNPVERCHCIANIGLQSVGMMRKRQSVEFERQMIKCNSNLDVRKECERNETFKNDYIASMESPKKLLEEVLGNMFLKDEQFSILPAATENDIEECNSVLTDLDSILLDADTFLQAKKSDTFKDFYEKHCTSRTYFFQVRKCNDVNCIYHEPLRGDETIDTFPDPVPIENDGVLHYTPGSDPTEKYLPSTLEDVEKSSHNIPFSPSAQTAKNVGFVIVCCECDKPRLLHSRNKIKKENINAVKRMMGKLTYVCGAAISEYVGTGADRDERFLNSVYARENISCASKIELPYYSVEYLQKICIYCGVGGTSRTLSNSVEHYPKCINCNDKPDVVRHKRKKVIESDLSVKKKK